MTNYWQNTKTAIKDHWYNMYCEQYNQLKITCNTNDNTVEIYPCCITQYKFNYIAKIPFNEFMNIENLYEYLNGIFTDNKKRIKTSADCDIYLDGKRKQYCEYSNTTELKKIDFSLTNTCNIACPMCRVKKIVSKKWDDLYFSSLYKIKNKHLNTIFLTALGEPFFYKEKTMDYILSLTKNDTENLCCTTNLTMLDLEDVYRLFKKNREDGVRIKFDVSNSAMTEATYKKVHNNNNFYKIMELIHLMHEFDLIDHVNFVAQPDNIHELVMSYKYWTSIGLNHRVLELNHSANNGKSTIFDTPEYIEYMKLKNKATQK